MHVLPADERIGVRRDPRSVQRARGPGGFLGFPTSNELTNPDGVGKRNTFQGAGSSIYWSPSTGAWQIGGDIFKRWGAMGYERGVLGYPTSNEIVNPDGVGRRNTFQKETGHIYWSPSTGAQAIQGEIFKEWGRLKYEAGILGYPTTSEAGTPDGKARFNHFAKNGSTYWSAAYGAVEIHGPVRTRWSSLGWERSCLGYPLTPVKVSGSTQRSIFERGTIKFDGTNTRDRCDGGLSQQLRVVPISEEEGQPPAPPLTNPLDEAEVTAYALRNNRAFQAGPVIGSTDPRVEHEPGGDGIESNLLLERDFVQECRTNPDYANKNSGSAYGWVKNRFEWCSVYRVYFGTTKEGDIGSFLLTTVGYTLNSSQFMRVYYLVSSISIDQFWDYSPDDFILNINGRCIENAAISRCDESSGFFDMTLPQWQAAANAHPTSPDVWVQLAGEPDVRNQREMKKAMYYLQTDVTILFAEGKTPTKPLNSLPQIPIRCDEAREFADTPTGCVWANGIPFLAYNALPDSGVEEVADHIDAALTNPDSTDPRKVGKVIPGGFGSGTLLHRIAQSDPRVNANRTASRRVCLSVDPNYAANGSQCDEFPFASTAEGAASGGDFSARALNGPQNARAGAALPKFYKDNRELVGDGFQVRIIR